MAESCWNESLKMMKARITLHAFRVDTTVQTRDSNRDWEEFGYRLFGSDLLLDNLAGAGNI